MHDYQLERLNTRSFEQLIQSLGLEIIGKQLIVFGDGPDGGREATFEGPVKYPEGEKQWDGYGMVQAKFRQIPDSSAKKNGDWAIAQLKAEFKKLKSRPKNKKGGDRGERYCPEFYVFATNLALSSVANKGGKDRVRATLDGFKKSHGLKDYALWDGDQIRRFLDTYPAIRVTYSAWLLPGDVLGEVIKHLKLTETGFLTTMNRFLASELLDDQYAKLAQGGYTEANTIPLSNIFVDLPVDIPAERDKDVETSIRATSKVKHSAEKDHPTFLQLFLEEGRQVLKPSANPRQLSETLHSRRTAGRLVLIGGPGQGKTTVGQFACQLLRASLLRSASTNHSPEVAQAIDLIEKQTKELPKPQVLRYPLRIDLKKLAEALAGKGDYTATSLLDYLVKYISKRTDSSLSKEELRKWLRGYPWLLVLDGLDEVPASSNRKEVMDSIRDFVSVEAQQLDTDLLILATTRPQGYSDEFDRSFYCHLPLAPLNAAEALTYGTKLAQARHPGLRSRVEELSSSLKRATTNPATVRLMESPLQVTIMLALIEGGGEPPEQRWKLFHDYYDVIYRREKERGTPFSAILGRYEPDINWIHHRAGWMLQQRNAAAGATAARLTHVEFEQMVDGRLQKRGHDETVRQSLVKQIREAATDRLVFLVGNTSKEIGFEIRSLQEFMAAEHCFDGSESCVQETIRYIAAFPYWRNVFLFVAGRIFFEKENLIDSLIAMCERLNEVLSDPAEGRIAAGSRLALAMLHDGAARNQPDNTRLLARCAAHLFKVWDGEEVGTIVSSFQGEASEVWKDEMVRRLQGTEARYPDILWRLCLHLVYANNSWAIELMNSRFPWNHPDSQLLIRSSLLCGDEVPVALVDMLKRHLLNIPPLTWIMILRPELPNAFKFAPLVQLMGIIQHHGIDGVVLTDEAGKATSNHIEAKGNSTIRLWAELRIVDVKDASLHPAWQAYHAISEFARTPTPENLAKQIEILFKFCPIFPSWTETWYIPWQISAVINAKASGIPLAEICRAILAGKLGVADDWSRWGTPPKTGIKFSSLGFPDGLLSASDDHQGAVYNNAPWNYSPDSLHSNFSFIKGFTAALAQLMPESIILSQLLTLSCYGLSNENPDWSDESQKVVREFIEGCQRFKFKMPRDIIIGVLGAKIEIDTKIKLLTSIRLSTERRSWIHGWERKAIEVNLACEQIIAHLNGSNVMIDLLVLLSHLPPLNFAKKIPVGVLKQCRNGDEFQNQSAIVFSSNTLDWRLEEAAQLAAEAWSIRKDRPYHLAELLEFIDSQGVHGLHLERFLLTLLDDERAGGEIGLRGEIATLLVKLVERRPPTSSLPDPSARNPASHEQT